MRKYFTYISIIAKNTFSTRKKLFAQMINHAIFMVFAFFLYRNVYLLAPGVSLKIPLQNAIWSMAMYYVIFWLGLRNLQKYFRNDVKTGNVEIYLLRPIGYIGQKILIQLGEGLLPFLFALVTSILVPYMLVGWPLINTGPLLFIVEVVIILILSQVLTAIIYIVTGLTAFWLEDSEPVYFLVSKLIMIFGNAWVPVAFFPEVLQTFAKYSPFGASMAFSFAMYTDFDQTFLFWCGVNIFWIIVLGVIMILMSRSAQRKLAVNG